MPLSTTTTHQRHPMPVPMPMPMPAKCAGRCIAGAIAPWYQLPPRRIALKLCELKAAGWTQLAPLDAVGLGKPMFFSLLICGDCVSINWFRTSRSASFGRWHFRRLLRRCHPCFSFGRHDRYPHYKGKVFVWLRPSVKYQINQTKAEITFNHFNQCNSAILRFIFESLSSDLQQGTDQAKNGLKPTRAMRSRLWRSYHGCAESLLASPS